MNAIRLPSAGAAAVPPSARDASDVPHGPHGADSPGACIVDIAGVSYSYGPTKALSDATLRLSGGVVAWEGPNGSGKTTLLESTAGLRVPTRGSIRIFGSPPTAAESKLALGFMPQRPRLWGDLSAIDHLTLLGRAYGLHRSVARERSMALLRAVGLDARANELVRRLSGGMQQRLNFACALVHGPSVLLLDEPESGMDAASLAIVTEMTKEFARNPGRLVVVASHQPDGLRALADTTYVLDSGRCIGPTRSLTRRPVEQAPCSELEGRPAPRLRPLVGMAVVAEKYLREQMRDGLGLALTLLTAPALVALFRGVFGSVPVPAAAPDAQILGNCVPDSSLAAATPSLLLFPALMMVFHGATATAREAESGSEIRWKLTPLSPVTIVGGHVIALAVTSTAATVLAFTVAALLGVTASGSGAGAVLAVVVACLGCIGIGLGVGAWAGNVPRAFVVASATMLVLLLLSAMVFPPPAHTSVLGFDLTRLLPTRIASDVLGECMRMGVPWSRVSGRLAGAAAINVAFLAAGTLALRKR